MVAALMGKDHVKTATGKALPWRLREALRGAVHVVGIAAVAEYAGVTVSSLRLAMEGGTCKRKTLAKLAAYLGEPAQAPDATRGGGKEGERG